MHGQQNIFKKSHLGISYCCLEGGTLKSRHVSKLKIQQLLVVLNAVYVCYWYI